MELKNVEFKEKQGFTQWYVWIILLVLNLMMIFSIYQVMTDSDRILTDIGVWILAIIFIPILIFSVFILTARLEITINTEGILLHYPMLKDKFYPWEDISQVYFRKVSGISEIGGYGIWFGNKRSLIYLIKGNTGLQIELKNKNKVLIGTGKQKEMEQVLKELGKIN